MGPKEYGVRNKLTELAEGKSIIDEIPSPIITTVPEAKATKGKKKRRKSWIQRMREKRIKLKEERKKKMESRSINNRNGREAEDK